MYLKITWQKSGKLDYMTIRQVTLDNYSKKIVKQFHSLKPKYSSKANMRNKGNAFFIDSNNKMWQMDMIEDVISLLGDIDRPAEAQLVLWLRRGQNAKEYTKTSNGYKLLLERGKGKKCYLEEVTITKKGKLASQRLKRGCQKIVKKKAVKSKHFNYQFYSEIVVDAKENIYLIGQALDTRSNNIRVATIDKYNRHGKRIWKRVLRDGGGTQSERLILGKKYIYFLNTSDVEKFIVKYSKSGKLISNKGFYDIDKNSFEDMEKKSNLSKLKKAPYYRKKNKSDVEFMSIVQSKNGNIYAVGREIIYTKTNISNDYDEDTAGAIIVKFNKKGHQIWSRSIDLR